MGLLKCWVVVRVASLPSPEQPKTVVCVRVSELHNTHVSPILAAKLLSSTLLFGAVFLTRRVHT